MTRTGRLSCHPGGQALKVIPFCVEEPMRHLFPIPVLAMLTAVLNILFAWLRSIVHGSMQRQLEHDSVPGEMPISYSS